jgi:hypothetical protein
VAVTEERWVWCDAALEREEPRGTVDWWSEPLFAAVGVTGLVGLLGDEGPGLLPSLVRFLLRKPRACIKRASTRQPTRTPWGGKV